MREATGSRSILTSSARFLRRAFPFSGEDKGEKNSQICSNKAGFSVWMCECAKVRVCVDADALMCECDESVLFQE